MGYRGGDLDLRTLQTGSATPAELGGWAQAEGVLTAPRGLGAYGGARPPIWVDDTVLACCNHAYEVALAHRAAEVRVEHLVHALTRIEAAADVLEARGLRVAALRRESASIIAIIAGDFPVSLSTDKASPTRSEALEEVLRLAASNAYKRGAPVSVDDIIKVLVEHRSDLPGVSLFARHIQRNVREPSEPLPPLSQIVSFGSEARFGDGPEPARERVRKQAGASHLLEPSREGLPENSGMPATTIGNPRLEAIEQLVRAVAAEVQNGRQVFAEVLEDLRRESTARREDVSRLSSGLMSRLEIVERGLGQHLSDLGRTWSILSDRLQGLEQAVKTGADQTRGLELTLAERSRGLVDLAPVNNRLDSIEAVLNRQQPDVRSLAAQLDVIEGAIAHGPDVGVELKSFAVRLAAIEATLGQALQPDLQPIAHRLDVIEEALLGRDAEFGRETLARLAALEQALSALEARSSADVTRVAENLAAQADGAERAAEALSGQLQGLSAGLAGQREELLGALSGSLLDKVSGSLLALEARATELLQKLSATGERVGGVEKALADAGQQAAERQASTAQEVAQIREALMRLNGNQSTLESSMGAWRTEIGSGLSVIANRLAAIEEAGKRQLQVIEPVSTRVEAVQKLVEEHEKRRGRFWYWLFGTDDWVAASWPWQTKRVEHERAKLKNDKV